MPEFLRTARLVLAEAFRPARKSGDVLDIKDIADAALRWISIPATSAVGASIQSFLPGVKNLYPWAFPLMMGHVAFTVLLLLAAIRLQLPRDRALYRLARLRSVAIRNRDQGLEFVEAAQVNPWIAEYHEWKAEVAAELEKLSPTEAEMFRGFDIVERGWTFGLTENHKLVLDEYTTQSQRLYDAIIRLKR